MSWRNFKNPLFLLATVPVFVILVLVLMVLWISFTTGTPGNGLKYTVANYLEAYTAAETYDMLVNTAIFTIIATIVALLIGVPIAWLVERTDFPGKSIVYTFMTLKTLLPGFFTAMGWLFLLHPRIGIISQYIATLFGLRESPIHIVNLFGMGWVQGLSLAPLTFIMTTATFKALHPQLDEAAFVHGLSTRSALWHISIPLVGPSLIATSIYTCTVAMAAFDVPAIIGLSNRLLTFSTYVYLMTNPIDGLPKYGLPSTLGLFMIGIAIILTIWYQRILQKGYRYQVVSGKAYTSNFLKLGRSRLWAIIAVVGYFLLSFGIPLLLIIWTSFMPYLQVPSLESLQMLTTKNYENLQWDLVIRGLKNTGILMIAVPSLVILFSIALSWIILRTKWRLRSSYDLIAFLPHAMPNIILAVGAAVFALFVIQPFIPLYGTIWLIVIVYTVVFLSFGVRSVSTSLLQIHQELEEAGYSSGLSLMRVIRHIILPLLVPVLASVWLWIAMLSYRELTMATVLFHPDNITLPLVIWSAWYGGGIGEASAISIILMACMIPFVLLYWMIVRKGGVSK